MTRGAQTTLTQQTSELAQENAQLKEELAFLQKLVVRLEQARAALSIQRLTVEPRARRTPGATACCWCAAAIRATNSRASVTLQATRRRAGARRRRAAVVTVDLPEDQPDAAAPLTLKFKYYQRVEGTIQRARRARS